MRYYSKSTDSVYLDHVHGAMPNDVVPLTEARYLEVIANPKPGKVRSLDADGLPILIDPPAQTLAVRSTLERVWRDEEIERVKWLRERHRDQLDIGQEPTLTPEQFSELLSYIRNLRDWPQSPEFPSADSRPTLSVRVSKQPQ